jgi:hypothetical protein
MLLVMGISHGMPSASPFDSFAEHTPPLFEIFGSLTNFKVPTFTLVMTILCTEVE